MKSPCRQDCPGRTSECHSTCRKYLLYEAWKHADYKRRELAVSGKPPTESFERIDRRNRMHDARRGRR